MIEYNPTYQEISGLIPPMKPSFFFSSAGYWFLLVLLVTGGCTRPESKSTDEPVGDGANQAASAKVSDVPLRVWIVSRTDPSEILVRHWLSDSEQPIDVQVLTADELLSRQDCPADVLITPTRWIGEIVNRKWVVKLPDAIADRRRSGEATKEAGSDSDPSNDAIPSALVVATTYDGVRYGLPIGFSTIHLVGSRSTNSEEISIEGLRERLSKIDLRPLEFDEAQIDEESLVDRFFAIAFAASPVNVKYGVLFEIRTMKARLASEEFVLAANLLKGLASQPDAELSVAGSHNLAWKWVNQSEAPVYALVSTAGLDAETQAMESAHWIPLVGARAWYDGSALMASLATQCRQTAQGTRFIEWLSQPRTIATLEPVLPGVVGSSSRSNSLADLANRKSFERLQDINASCEPRLLHTYEYRKILAAQLLAILRGEKEVHEGLSAAAEAWDTISLRQFKLQQIEYEKSLDLTR